MEEIKLKRKNNLFRESYRFGSKWYNYTKRLNPSMYYNVLFVETFTKTPEKEFVETRGFKNMSSEALKILAKKIADYIKYRLEIKGNIFLDYDDDIEEVFIRIKLQSHENSTEKAKLERWIISKTLEGFSSDEIENITIMVE